MQWQQPFFSIIIPTYNRQQQLTRCLESLTQLDYPRQDFEVIIVDDGSHVAFDIPVSFQNQINITLLRQSNSGPATARNTGAAKARGKYIAFTDDDCTPAPNWLKTLTNQFIQTPDCMIGGYTINAIPENPYSTASQLLNDYLYNFYNTNDQQPKFFTSNNIALPASIFQQLGGFDTSFPLAAGEDREFCDRWLNYGYKIIYAPEAIVCHAHDLTLSKYWRQHFNYGRGAFWFRQIKSNRESKSIQLESLSFYINLLLYPFFKTSRKSALLIFGLFFISQLANTLGFYWQSKLRTI